MLQTDSLHGLGTQRAPGPMGRGPTLATHVAGHGVDEGAERVERVCRTLEEATARPGRPDRVMSDKGAAFWS